jgi:hypothetical protein
MRQKQKIQPYLIGRGCEWRVLEGQSYYYFSVTQLNRQIGIV